ncbi:MAG: hypothetical protein EBU90_30170, partial [Proteobacteria bacterium]|nr:hypothetical protein [Pseudomonadota bacterium]
YTGSANWQSTYITVSSLSSNWSNPYTTVISNSSTWTQANTALQSFVPNWNSTYTTVSAYSAVWGIGSGYSLAATVSSLSSNWNSTYVTVSSLSASWIYDGGNTNNKNISIGTNDNFGLNLETANSNRMVILSTGEVTINSVVPNISANRNALDVRGTMVVYSEIASLTGLSALSGSSPGQFSAGGMLIGQNEGGAYIGRVGVRENSWKVLSGSEGVNWFYALSAYVNFQGIAMSSDGRIQAAAANNAAPNSLYISYDYGKTWTTGALSNLTEIVMSSDGRIQVATDKNIVYISYDYGKNWNSRLIQAGVIGIQRMAISADGKIIAAVSATANSPIFISYDYGVTWVSRGAASVRYGIAMSSDGRIMATGDGTTVWTSYDYGINWVNRSLTGDCRDVAMSSDGRIMTILNYANGYIYTSHNYGVTWVSRGNFASFRWKIAMSSDGR